MIPTEFVSTTWAIVDREQWRKQCKRIQLLHVIRAGDPPNDTGFTTDAMVGPAGIASDTSGNIWTANYGAATSSVLEAVPDNASPSTDPTFSNFTGAGLNSPYGIAIDASGHIWVTNRGGNGSISELNASGGAISPDPAGYTGGGVNSAYGIAVDGAGNVWTANNGGAGGTASANSIRVEQPSRAGTATWRMGWLRPTASRSTARETCGWRAKTRAGR